MKRVAHGLFADQVSLAGPFPSFRSVGRHRVIGQILYLTQAQVPDAPTIAALVDRAVELITQEDTDFDRDRHLTMSFVVVPNDVRARWFRGRLRVEGSTG
jgi:hypothetical protein